MRVAFLGNLRFIGRAAAEHAVQAGHQVTILHTGKYPPQVDGAEHVVADRNDPSALRTTIQRARPDVIVDTFAMTRADGERAVEAFAGIGARVVVLSSQDVYAQFGRLLGHAFEDVEDLVSERSPVTVPYPFRGKHDHVGGESYDKKDVERVYRNASANFDSVTILRLPATYGTYDKTRRFAWIVDRLDSGVLEVPHVDNASWRWTHGHVGDIAEAILLAAKVATSGLQVFNVGEDPTPTMHERVELIARRMNASIRWEKVDELPEDLSFLGRMSNDFVADTALIRAALGYEEATTPEDRADDLIEWLRASRHD